MGGSHDQFAKRIEKLEHKHKKMAFRYSASLSREGLFVARQQQNAELPWNNRLRFAVLVACGFFAFKGFALAAYGPVTYNNRLAQLRSGTIVETYGAKLLEIDLITQGVADFVSPLFHKS